MASPRALAHRPGHWIVTVWPTEQHRDEGGWALCCSDTAMSDGSDITVVDGDKVLVFPPLLGNSLSLTRAMEESPGSVRLSIYWQIYAGVAQKHIDLTEGVADIS